MPKYELGDKFWQIDRKGTAFTTTAGKIGKPGHTKIKELASPAEAKRAYEDAIAAKLKEGYVLAGAAPATDDDAIPRAVEAMKAWCRNNGVGEVAKNLAKGASDAAIAKAEKQLGVTLHPELRRLWKLHDGQRDKKTRFLEGDFLSLAEAIAMRPALAEPWLPISSNHENGELVIVRAETGSVAKLPAKGKKPKVVATSPSAWIAAFVKSLGGSVGPEPKPPAKPIKPAKPMNTDKLAAAIERAKTWMQNNGAAVLVKNLAKPATDAALAKCEKALGFAVPAELAALWRIHDGQKREQNGFIGSLDLLGTRDAPSIREDVLHSVRWMLEDEDMVEEAALRPEETNEDWVPFGTRDSDHLVVHAISGRVFRVAKDAPPLSLAAKSLTEFFERYAKAMEKGEYVVEEGFGDVYLQAG